MDQNPNNNTEDAADKLRREALSGWEAVESGAGKLEDAAQGTVEEFRQTASEAVEEAKANVENAWQDAGSSLDQAADKAAEEVGQAADAVAEEVDQAVSWGTEPATIVPSFESWKSQQEPAAVEPETWSGELYKAPEPEPVVPAYVPEAPVRPVEPQVTPPTAPASTWPQSSGPDVPATAGTYVPPSAAPGTYVPPAGLPQAKSSGKLPTWAIVLLVILAVLCLCCVIVFFAFPGVMRNLDFNSFVPFYNYLS